jgi:hypothetical protein
MKHRASIVHYTMDKIQKKSVAKNHLFVSDISEWEINVENV